MLKRTVDFLSAAAVVAALPVFASGAELSDREIWNLGVEEYRSGDFSNAVQTLGRLESSRTHRTRAAELLARIYHDRAHDPAASGNALEYLEEASRYAQIALRSNPSGEKERRNFARAIGGVEELRETKRINGIMERLGGRDPGSLLRGALADVRNVLEETAAYATNSAEKAVEDADRLSKRLSGIADVWVAVNKAIVAAVTNAEDAATISDRLEQAAKNTDLARRLVGDIEEGAYSAVADVESDVNRFFKMTALPPDALAEGFIAQSNAWQDVAALNGRAWQREALDFTRAFRAKFPAWAKNYEERAAADTNMPPFTAQTQSEISALSTELEKIQIECVAAPLPPEQEKALDILAKIDELMPKEKNGGGKSGAPQGGRGAASSGEKNKEQGKDDGQGDDAPRAGENDGGNQKPREDGQSGEDAGGEREEPPTDREVESILQKAKERTDEYESEKKARMRKARLSPGERDW